MKFYFFHLMPYAALDLNYTDKYRTCMTVLPNSYYDPVQGHQLYNRYLDELELADQLGYDGICVNEHHQTAYGMMPEPIVTASALSRRTRHAKIAIMGTAFCLRDNPLVAGEAHAMIDNITGGRLITGMVRGVGIEYFSTGVNPAHSRERFIEAHDLLVKAWSEPGPFEFYGKHYKFPYVNMWPRPFQRPHQPIWIPSQGSVDTIEFAALHRHTYLQVYTPWAVVQKYIKMYYEVAAAQYGYQADDSQLGWCFPCYVAETDEQARREAKQHIETLFTKFINAPPQMLMPPGYVSVRAIKGFLEATTRQARGGAPSMEDMIDNGMFICGSPQTVRQMITERYADAPFGHALLLSQFATLPHELTVKNLTLFAQEVMSHLHGLGHTVPQLPAGAPAH